MTNKINALHLVESIVLPNITTEKIAVVNIFNCAITVNVAVSILPNAKYMSKLLPDLQIYLRIRMERTILNRDHKLLLGRTPDEKNGCVEEKNSTISCKTNQNQNGNIRTSDSCNTMEKKNNQSTSSTAHTIWSVRLQPGNGVP